MEKHVFIQANNKQLFGAKIARYAIESQAQEGPIPVTIINVDAIDIFQGFAGSTFLRSKGDLRTFTAQDLQSFTLSRFMPPALMGYTGKAVVIDPDIFACTDIHELSSLDLGGAAIAACRKKDAWDTSLMLLDCAQLRHWDIGGLLTSLKERMVVYSDIMSLRTETAPIMELPRVWNSLDHLDGHTKMLHTTNRLTQPWKTGLPIDFTRNKAPKILGIFPREPLQRLLGKIPSTYQKHPDAGIERFFFTLVRDALTEGYISQEEIDTEIRKGNVRKDFREMLTQV